MYEDIYLYPGMEIWKIEKQILREEKNLMTPPTQPRMILILLPLLNNVK